MKRMLAVLLMSATIGLTFAATTTDASAYWRRGWGWGPGVAAGVVGGAIIAGAIVASRPAGYVVYPGYAQPLYGPGCYWTSQAAYDPYGRVVGTPGSLSRFVLTMRLRRQPPMPHLRHLSLSPRSEKASASAGFLHASAVPTCGRIAELKERGGWGQTYLQCPSFMPPPPTLSRKRGSERTSGAAIST